MLAALGSGQAGRVRARNASQARWIFVSVAGFSMAGVYIVANPSFENSVTMSNDVKENLKSRSTWMRGLYFLIYAVFYTIAEIVVFALIIFQFLLKLFTADTNERLRKLGQGLSTYIYQILQYMNFNSDYQPYPFGAWPKGGPKGAGISDQGSSSADKD
jgi:hypothetical protein